MFLIQKFWDGTVCNHRHMHGQVSLLPESNDLRMTARLPHQKEPNNPKAPPGRFDGLWDYDVVECFLVGANGKYLEIELGAAGHFLAFSFSAPRVRENEYNDFHPKIDFIPDTGDGCWQSSMVIPRDMLPLGIHAMNCFVIVGQSHARNYLSMSPLPGSQPDFHQPDRFPQISIPGL